MAKKAAVKEEPKKGKGKKAAAVEEKPAKAAKGKKAAEVAEEAAAVEEKPAKAAKGKKAAPAKEVKRGRGRIAGVRNEVTAKDAKLIQDQFTVIENAFAELTENVDKFLGGNKASVGKARKNVQEMLKMGKDFRKTLQNAKVGMKQVSA